MNDDNGFGVPAGWYPDPLGLPQMRWWDNHGWTEHTTEARAPIVIQEAKLAWADDDIAAEDLPTRRERREREREEDSTDRGTTDESLGNADALLELEPPSWDVIPADEPAPAAPIVPEFTEPVAAQPEVVQPVVTAPAATVAEPVVAAPVAAAPIAAEPVAPAAAAPAPAAVPATGFVPGGAPSANTAGAWIIALMPLAQLVLTLLVVAASGSAGTTVNVIIGILLAPYAFSIPFAISDQRALKRHGYENAASWAWVLLSGPIYLIARAIRVVMKAGNGFGPILVWGGLVLLQLGSIVAVPGLVISALPQVFAQEAAQSIQHDASVFGPIVSVKCPAPPATVMGQEFACTLNRIGSGQTYKVTASLQRENGWISWVVKDWGVYQLNR